MTHCVKTVRAYDQRALLSSGTVMLLHHVLSIYGTSFVLYRGVNGAELMATLGGSEITNPFLQARWFLRETDQHRTWYAECNNVIFILVFTVTRVCVGTWFISIYLRHPGPDLASKIGSFAFYTVSMALWVQIVRYAVRHFCKFLYNVQETPEVTAEDLAKKTHIQPSVAVRDGDTNSSVIVRHSTAVE